MTNVVPIREPKPVPEPPGSARDRYYAQMTQYAKESFAAHEISEWLGSGRWLLKKKDKSGVWEGHMSAEIICTHNRMILVEGDSPSCRFGYGPADYVSRIGWLGSLPEVSSYVFEKACPGDVPAPSRWDRNIAESEMLEVLEIPDHYDLGADEVGALRDSLDGYMDEGQDRWLSSIYYTVGSDFMTEVASTMGVVPEPRVFYAHASIARLWEILSGSA